MVVAKLSASNQDCGGRGAPARLSRRAIKSFKHCSFAARPPSTAAVTVTVKLQVAGWPAASLAVQETVLVPTANVLPDGGVQLAAIMPSHASLARVVKLTTAPLAPLADTVLFVGQVMVGAVVSAMVTLKLQLLALPAAVVAVHVTVVWPFEKTLPEAGVHVTGNEAPD
jgi:hypothetical protein